MKYNQLRRLAFFLPLIVFHCSLTAQSLSSFNQFVPAEMVDARSSVFKNVMGIGSFVQASVNAGIKNADACSDSDYGNLHIDISWYNESDEGGKVMLQMMRDMNGIESQKDDFFHSGSFDPDQSVSEDLAGGTLLYVTHAKPCINTISGPTGQTEHSTEARFFAFFEDRVITVDLSAKIKPETARNLIIRIAEKANNFDFSSYKSVVAQGND